MVASMCPPLVFVATFTDRASAGPAEFRDLRQARGPDPQIRGCTRRVAHMAPSWCARGERLLYKRLGASMHRPLGSRFDRRCSEPRAAVGAGRAASGTGLAVEH